MRTTIVFPFLMLALAACGSTEAANGGPGGAGGDPGSGGNGGDTGTDFKATWSHTFPSIFVESGTEHDYDCQAVILNNEETLYVTGVRQTNDGAWHHSNWFYVPEDSYGGDGTFDCRYTPNGRFDMVSAAVSGGVVFAQSTQNLEETFRFPARSAVVIPPHSKIIGALHLVNIAAGDIDTSITLEFETAEPEEIDVSLQPLSYLIYSLDIPSQQESRWRMSCEMGSTYDVLGRDDTFGIYYVLGHYHSWGNYFALSYVDEDGSERPIVELESVIGDSLGRVIDPPVFANGASHMKVTCGYNNTTDANLTWGNDADKEMCMFLAYVGAPVKVVAWGQEAAAEVGMVDGVRTYEAQCPTVTAFPSDWAGGGQ